MAAAAAAAAKVLVRKEDFIDILLRGCREAGCVPIVSAPPGEGESEGKGEGSSSPPVVPCVPAMLPADVAASWIVSLARGAASSWPPRAGEAQAFHLVNPHRALAYADALARTGLPAVPYDQWFVRRASLSSSASPKPDSFFLFPDLQKKKCFDDFLLT